jgi:endo-alpha-1,4-polygalactosaminidase (GH114 family)
MIGRRSFALGMASLLAASRAAADVMINDRVLPDPGAAKKPRRDVPFTPLEKIPNHRQLMRDIVVTLSDYAKQRNPHFFVIARNGLELLVKENREYQWETLRDPDGAAADKYPKPGTIFRPYLKAIDGMLIDGTWYGAAAYGKPTAEARTKYVLSVAEIVRAEGRLLLTIDYCADRIAAAAAEATAAKVGALGYVDRDGDKLLGHIPPERPRHENPDAIGSLMQARNFIPLLRSDGFATRIDWVNALAATNYDMLVIDTFWRESQSISFEQMRQLRYKRLGTDRLVFGVLPLGVARDTRFYWKPDWKPGNPAFLAAPDPTDPAQAIVNYWDNDWKSILGKYIQGIVDLGVDGVVLDQLDAYLYFEDQMPLK